MSISEELYNKTLDNAFLKLEKAILDDVKSDKFNWDLLVEMMIIDDSPLVELFSHKTMQLAELYSTAKKLATIADDIENSKDDVQMISLPEKNEGSNQTTPNKEWDGFENL